METTDLEAKVYSALTSDIGLMAKLTQSGTPIYHLQKPATESDHYPYLVYAPISDIPALSGQDEELYHRVTMRFHIVTKDGEYAEINALLKSILLNLGFRRVQTIPYVEDKEKILISDYRIGVESL